MKTIWNIIVSNQIWLPSTVYYYAASEWQKCDSYFYISIAGEQPNNTTQIAIY